MPTPRFNYTPRWVLDAQKLQESRKRKSDTGHSVSPSLPPLLSQVEMQNNPDPTGRIGTKLGWLGQDTEAKQTGIQQAGLHLLSTMGPREAGTFDTVGNFANAAAHGINSYKSAQIEGAEKAQLARMASLQQDEDVLAGMTESQRKIFQALPPPAAAELVSSVNFAPGESTLMQVRDDEAGVVHLVNNRTGQTARDIDISQDKPDLNVHTTADGTMIWSDKRTGSVMQTLSPNAQNDDAKAMLELQDGFNSRPEARIWAETLVQLEGAQEAAAKGDPVADLQLIVAYAKILDPTSVVREGEVTVVRDTGSLPDWLVGRYNKATGEGLIGFQHRKNLLASIERIATKRFKAFERSKAQASPLYEQMGYDPQKIFGAWTAPTWVTTGGLGGGTIGVNGMNIPPNPVSNSINPTPGTVPLAPGTGASRFLPGGGQ